MKEDLDSIKENVVLLTQSNVALKKAMSIAQERVNLLERTNRSLQDNIIGEERYYGDRAEEYNNRCMNEFQFK